MDHERDILRRTKIIEKRKNLFDRNKPAPSDRLSKKKRKNFRNDSHDERKLWSMHIFDKEDGSEKEIKSLPSATKQLIKQTRMNRRVGKSCHCSKCGKKTQFQEKTQAFKGGMVKQQIKNAEIELLKKVLVKMIYNYRRRKNIQKRSTNKFKSINFFFF